MGKNTTIMKNVRILLVEDDVFLANKIARDLKLLEYDIAAKIRYGEEVLPFLEENSAEIDVILMDIKLEGKMTGVEVVERFQRQKNFTPVIYLSSLSEGNWVDRAIATRPANYLTKSFNAENMNRAIRLAIEHANHQKKQLKNKKPNKYIFLRDDSGYKRLKVADILWVEADKNYCYIKTKGRTHTQSKAMSNFNKEHDHPDLFQVHRSYTINIEKISDLKGRFVYIEGGEYADNTTIKEGKIPIGRTYRKALYEKLGI